MITREEEAGDELHFLCVLHDPASGRFSAPPEAASWTSLSRVTPGACGKYLFNSAGDVFSFAERVCRVGGACTELGGTAQGWLEPGPRVGSP